MARQAIDFAPSVRCCSIRQCLILSTAKPHKLAIRPLCDMHGLEPARDLVTAEISESSAEDFFGGGLAARSDPLNSVSIRPVHPIARLIG